MTPIADRQEPWWFFGWVFLAGTVPWTVPALRVLVSGWRSPRGQFSPTLFLWIWVVFTCVFFSFSDSKLMPYILPAMPALALLIARAALGHLEARFAVDEHLDHGCGAGLGCGELPLPELMPLRGKQPYLLLLAKPAREIAVLLLVSGLFVWVSGAAM